MQSVSSPVGLPVGLPTLARIRAIEHDAAAVLAHVLSCGVRFDARRKIAEAEEFTFNVRGSSSLAVPSKLVGTAVLQGNVRRVVATAEASGARLTYRPLHLLRVEDDRKAAKPGSYRLAALDAETGLPLGFLQDKHQRWLLPLLRQDEPEGYLVGVSLYVLAVTGGTPERPTHGVNVVIAGAAEAVRRLYGNDGGVPEVEPEVGPDVRGLAERYARQRAEGRLNHQGAEA